MTSAEQVGRLLALVPYLQARPDADLAETATVFGVDTGQLLADLKVLWYCGLPDGLPGDLIEIDMDAVAEQGRIRLSNADFLSRPMRFTTDEATSLVVALRAVGELAGGDLAAGVDSALAKLEAAVGAGIPVPRVALASGSEDVREQLASAIGSRVLVSLDYHGVGAQPSRPTVAPVRLISRDGYGYLQAWSPAKAGWRNYRLDRIQAVDVSDQRAPDPGEPPEFGPGWLDELPHAAEVTLRVRPGADWIAEYYPNRGVRRDDDGVEVDLLVADPGWLRTVLLQLGSQVLAVTPPEAAQVAVATAREALAAYDAG